MPDTAVPPPTPAGGAPTAAPPGHSRAGHRAHGWCSACKDREVWEELHAWRARDNQQQSTPPPADRVPVPGEEAGRG